MNHSIAVSGSGSAAAPPDIAVVQVGVEVLAKSVVAARNAASQDMAAIIASLRGNGLKEAEIATTAYSINPEYDHRDGRRLRGYRVTNVVEARISDLDSLGRIIDEAASAGSDHVVVRGLRFAHRDESSLAQTARSAAWEDARSKASQLADLAGVALGGVLAVAERQSQGGGPTPMRAMAMESPMTTPIESGELAVSVSLAVEFALNP